MNRQIIRPADYHVADPKVDIYYGKLYLDAERFNSNFHIVVALLFFAFGIVRVAMPEQFVTRGLVGVLVSTSIFSFAVLFTVSAIYHRAHLVSIWFVKWMGFLDYVAVFTSQMMYILSIIEILRLSPDSNKEPGLLSSQTWADLILSFGLIVTALSIFHLNGDIQLKSRGDTMQNFEHPAHHYGAILPTRSICDGLLFTTWILYSGWMQVTNEYNIILITSLSVGTLFVSFSRLNDMFDWTGVCKKGGCVIEPHGLWHFVTLIVIVLLVTIREMALNRLREEHGI